MPAIPKKNTARKPDPAQAASIYNIAIALARAPVFYTRFGVVDSVDGRYDLFCLMLSLILFRTQQASPELAQAVFDLAFKDVERGLREAGIGDLGVPKHMKRMLEAFYGRSAHYYEALDQHDLSSLTESLQRNLYNNNDPKAPAASMAEWVQIAWNFLRQTESGEFLQTPGTVLELLPPHEEANQ